MRGAGFRQDDDKPKPIMRDHFLVGRRMWSLCRDRERWRLTNIAHATDDYWPRGVYEADCERWQRHSDRGPSPHPSCSCGMYGFWDMESLVDQMYPNHDGLLTGIVWAWGRTLPGIEGFKSQFMLPVAVDYPVCMVDPNYRSNDWNSTTRRILHPRSGMARCPYPVAWMEAQPRYVEEYPQPGDEDWEIGHEWVNCRVDAPMWVCEEHVVVNSQQRDRWKVRASEVMRDLEVYYELEVLPPLDFSIKNYELHPDGPLRVGIEGLEGGKP